MVRMLLVLVFIAGCQEPQKDYWDFFENAIGYHVSACAQDSLGNLEDYGECVAKVSGWADALGDGRWYKNVTVKAIYPTGE